MIWLTDLYSGMKGGGGGGFYLFIFFLLGLTPCKAEQPLQCMELQEKEAQKD